MQKERPVYLDIHKIRLPIPGIVSIFHRFSGVALFICIPLLLWLFSGTLSHESAFNTYHALVQNPLVKCVLFVLLLAYVYHSLAGVRFLLLDIHKGTELKTARTSAKAVVVCAIVLTVIIYGACLLS
ncbi:succinate dehydrogenase, cytochrome b556 subunit [Snodgrassella sp. ESL0253]|uniref:succinate dehydrogenase, cytochrome b556 subunit n=1 Tax=Snodgrassella sp. ESL0253 TaxID=2705031 RepID=UPI0015842245|nr:succinate dehydrogenase, cytochrome b556 subunit [Snodgrassella sp. ESL0253]NUE67222.1 succinate dehydrogenase, cytochrome b556 subunit [Snodgrassella sp. ESL0253]